MFNFWHMIVEWSLLLYIRVLLCGNKGIVCVYVCVMYVCSSRSTNGPVVCCLGSPRATSRSYALDAPDQPNRTGWCRGASKNHNYKILKNIKPVPKSPVSIETVYHRRTPRGW